MQWTHSINSSKTLYGRTSLDTNGGFAKSLPTVINYVHVVTFCTSVSVLMKMIFARCSLCFYCHSDMK